MRATHLAVAAAAFALWGAVGQSKAGEIISSLEGPIVGVGMICNTPGQAQTYLDRCAKGVLADDTMKRIWRARACLRRRRDRVRTRQDAARARGREQTVRGCANQRARRLRRFRMESRSGETQYAVMESKGDAI
jgi:hypothetical protein